jgi:hypothetical protein
MSAQMFDVREISKALLSSFVLPLYSRSLILRGAEADCPLPVSKRAAATFPSPSSSGLQSSCQPPNGSRPGYEPGPLLNYQSLAGCALTEVDPNSRGFSGALTPYDAACEAGRSVLSSESDELAAVQSSTRPSVEQAPGAEVFQGTP